VLAHARGRWGVPGRAQLPVHRSQGGPEPLGVLRRLFKGNPWLPASAGNWTVTSGFPGAV